MRINITKKTRRLETISERDVLIFPDREEEIVEVDVKMQRLYTQRETKSDTDKQFPFRTETVAYHGEKVTPNSIGHVIDYTKRRKK
jgi:hypothetical protein